MTDSEVSEVLPVVSMDSLAVLLQRLKQSGVPWSHPLAIEAREDGGMKVHATWNRAVPQGEHTPGVRPLLALDDPEA